MSKAKWADADERKAFENGWAIFDYDSTGILVVMKIDDIQSYRYDKPALAGVANRRHFRSDDGAYKFVKREAEKGCSTAKKALALCPRQEEYLAGSI